MAGLVTRLVSAALLGFGTSLLAFTPRIFASSCLAYTCTFFVFEPESSSSSLRVSCRLYVQRYSTASNSFFENSVLDIHKARGHVPPLLQLAGHGGTVGMNGKQKSDKIVLIITKAFTKRLIVLLEPKKWTGTTKIPPIWNSFRRHVHCSPPLQVAANNGSSSLPIGPNI